MMPLHADSRLVYEVGQGSVRVQIVQTPYGYCEVRPVHYNYSLLTGEMNTDDSFDRGEIDELVHLLLQAKAFLHQQCSAATQAAS